MRLPAFVHDLRLTLSTKATERIFNASKQHHPDLAPFSTPFALLAVLENHRVAGYAAQEKILRALIAEDQRRPEQRLWRTLLFFAFLPSMIGLRARVHPVEGGTSD